MSVFLPDGATVSIAKTYGDKIQFSAITNAASAVATLAADHGIVQSDIVEVISGWGKLNNRIARVGNIAINAATFEKMDTTSVRKFSPGSGIGSIRKVVDWQDITQILEVTGQGGDMQTVPYTFLDDDEDHELPTSKSPQSLALSLADDDTLPWYDILDAASEDKLPRALRISLPSGSEIYYQMLVGFNSTPTLTKKQVMAVRASFYMQSKLTRYAAE